MVIVMVGSFQTPGPGTDLASLAQASQALTHANADADDEHDDNAAATAKTPTNSERAESPIRVTRVVEREGLPPLSVRPCAPALTDPQQAERVTDLQNQTRYTIAVQPHVLRRHLRNNNWNVIDAADAFWEEEEAARNRTILPDPYYDIPVARTVGNSRLHARTALRRHHNTGDESTNSIPQTNTAIFGLLQRNLWILDQAEEDYRSNNGNLDDITDAYSSLRIRRPVAMEQDARLAAFVSLTSTNSIHAARRHLALHR
jgi:hypothetical protein